MDLSAFAPCISQTAKLLLYQTLQALHFMHQKGITHRDLKPANVLITTDGAQKHVKVGYVHHINTLYSYCYFHLVNERVNVYFKYTGG